MRKTNSVFFCICLISFSVLSGQENVPIYEKIPYDRIILVPEEGGGVFDVFPINFPGGRKPASLPSSGELIVKFLELPTEEYAINWTAIAKVDTFHEMVFVEMSNIQSKLIDKVDALPENDADPDRKLKSELAELYGYYNFLFNSSTKPPGLVDMHRQYLLAEAVYYQKIKDWANSVTRLERLYAEQKDYPGLAENWSKVLSETLKDSTDKGDYRQARALIRYFNNYFPNHQVATRWKQAYINRAKSLLEDSVKRFASGEYPLALQKCNEAVNVYPKLPGLKEHAEKLHDFLPQVIIGVTNPSSTVMMNDKENEIAPFNTSRLLLPGRIRVGRLMEQMLLEQTGFATEGGKYHTLLGDYTKKNNGTLIQITLDEKAGPYPDKIFSASAIAESLLDFSRKEHNEAASIWDGFFDAIEIEDTNRIAVKMKRRNVLPESMLCLPVRIYSDNESDGSFSLFKQGPNESIFLSNRKKTPSSTGPQIVVERFITDTKTGLQQLASGQISAIDRVAPWEIEPTDDALQRCQVGKYVFPSIHFLVPNRNKPLTSSRTFRRGLLYGLNREWVVSQLSGSGNKIDIISGPSAKGSTETDPIDYGYDRSIVPRAYDPKLAAALCLMSLTQARDNNQLSDKDLPEMKRDNPLAEDMPEIVLAAPQNSAAQTACFYIMRQWEAIGIPVRLVSYGPDEPIGRGTEIDLWYVSCQISEPMFSVRAILDGNGLVGSSSAYMSLALEKLRLAEDWPGIAKEMRAIHRWCYEETTILPLWQWRDCFIVRKDLTGFTDSGWDIHNFYQGVEKWSVPFFWDDTLE